MTIQELKIELLKLPVVDRNQLIAELQSGDTIESKTSNCQKSRRDILNNKLGICPHCGGNKYVKFGFKSKSQRYKCKSCHRSFTEYSGTWMAGIHHKDKMDDYIGLMVEEQTLDKIKEKLSINKKTAFDWRHKILASLSQISTDDFTGITESDETFFLSSEKGRKVHIRKSRKRGGSSKTSGISNDQVAVIVTQDRKSNLDLTVATLGRIKKADIENAIGSRVIPNKTILCSDSHISYKGFAMDKKLEHHAIKTMIRKRVKNKEYNIQHVNSTHNKLKKWIDSRFWGVSTKYLQQYLNWYKIKEIIKDKGDKQGVFISKASEDVTAHRTYRNIQKQYEKLISTQL